MPDIDQIVRKAREFAKALDECDYQAARQYLAASCRYILTSDDTYVGCDAILAAYQASDEKARRQFDRITYSSDVSLAATGSATLTFVDELQKGDFSHTFRCSQIVYFDEDERIHRIEHREIPGELERLNDFRQSVGCVST